MTVTFKESHVRTVEITMSHRLGFQFWLAAEFAQCMREFRSAIQVRQGDFFADGKNIVELLALEAPLGSHLEIKAVGDDAQRAIASVEAFFLKPRDQGQRAALKVVW